MRIVKEYFPYNNEYVCLIYYDHYTQNTVNDIIELINSSELAKNIGFNKIRIGKISELNYLGIEFKIDIIDFNNLNENLNENWQTAIILKKLVF